MTITDEDVIVDFGRGLGTVPLHRIGNVIPVRFRGNQKPRAIVLAPTSVTESGRWDRNRILTKAKEGAARLQDCRGRSFCLLRYFGEDQADRIVAAVEKRPKRARHEA